MKLLHISKPTVTILLLLFTNVTQAQISTIKEQMLELFWYLPSYSEKFDIRTKLHGSNNFTKVEDSDLRYNSEALYANFNGNKQLTSLGQDNVLNIYFDKASLPDQWVIISNYLPEEVNKCQVQFEQAVAYLKKISFKANPSTNTNVDDKLIGRGYWFYSSQTMLNQRKPYATINYSFKSYKNQYEFNIYFYPSALK
jgi:hypothetical protein